MRIKLRGRVLTGRKAESCCSDRDLNQIEIGCHIKVVLFDENNEELEEACYLKVLKISNATKEIEDATEDWIKKSAAEIPHWDDKFAETLCLHTPFGPEKFRCSFDTQTAHLVKDGANGKPSPIFIKGDCITVPRSCIWDVTHSKY